MNVLKTQINLKDLIYDYEQEKINSFFVKNDYSKLKWIRIQDGKLVYRYSNTIYRYDYYMNEWEKEE